MTTDATEQRMRLSGFDALWQQGCVYGGVLLADGLAEAVVVERPAERHDLLPVGTVTATPRELDVRVYLAGPLFTPYQRDFLDDLARRLRQLDLEVFVPHEHLLDGPLRPTEVFDTDAEGLRAADVVLAVLDGTEVDDGTACEIGLFSELLRTGARQGAIIGLMTDIRALRGAGDGPHMNLFVRGCVERFGELHTDVDRALGAVAALAT